MWLDGIKRFASRLGRVRRKSRALTESAASREAPYDTEFDTTWHGDHWQNLLSSPLDARHYVMEDWTYTPPPPTKPRRPHPRPSASGARSRNSARTDGAKKKRDWEVAPTKVWRSFPSTKKSASESRDRSIAREQPFISHAPHKPLLPMCQ